jgi:hypothetical protein
MPDRFSLAVYRFVLFLILAGAVQAMAGWWFPGACSAPSVPALTPKTFECEPYVRFFYWGGALPLLLALPALWSLARTRQAVDAPGFGPRSAAACLGAIAIGLGATHGAAANNGADEGRLFEPWGVTASEIVVEAQRSAGCPRQPDAALNACLIARAQSHHVSYWLAALGWAVAALAGLALHAVVVLSWRRSRALRPAAKDDFRSSAFA